MIEKSPLASSLVFKIATAKAIEKSDNRVERAQRIITIAEKAKSMLTDNESTSLDYVESAIRDNVKWDELDESNKLVIDILIDLVRAEIDKKVGDGSLDPNDKLIISNILRWIIESAQMYD
jgi:molecular chaperone DnaK (HSP70)